MNPERPTGHRQNPPAAALLERINVVIDFAYKP
jgi:hypothetical protein